MTALVIAEHDHATVKPATLNTVTAALACGGDVHVLVAGANAAEAGKAAAQIVKRDATYRGLIHAATGTGLVITERPRQLVEGERATERGRDGRGISERARRGRAGRRDSRHTRWR